MLGSGIYLPKYPLISTTAWVRCGNGIHIDGPFVPAGCDKAHAETLGVEPRVSYNVAEANASSPFLMA